MGIEHYTGMHCYAMISQTMSKNQSCHSTVGESKGAHAGVPRYPVFTAHLPR
jgi:hypothetical protein